jgi:hypothetical protein
MQPRPISVIQQQMISYAQTNYGTSVGQPFYYIFHDSNGNAITPSQANLFILITYIVATAISLFEQVMFLFQNEIEALVATSAAGTAQWLRSQCLAFQYSATTPQVVQYNTTTNTIAYPVVNTSLQIITQCAVQTNINNVVLIKVNTTSSGVLSSPQLTAFQSYLNQIVFAGTQYNVISALPDYLMVGVQVYYNGQYTPTITTDVPNAINNYLANLPYNGNVDLTELEEAILSAQGVNDVVFTQVEIRANGVSVGNATKLVNASTTLIPYIPTYAGTAIIDTAAGRTLTDTVSYIPQ